MFLLVVSWTSLNPRGPGGCNVKLWAIRENCQSKTFLFDPMFHSFRDQSIYLYVTVACSHVFWWFWCFYDHVWKLIGDIWRLHHEENFWLKWLKTFNSINKRNRTVIKHESTNHNQFTIEIRISWLDFRLKWLDSICFMSIYSKTIISVSNSGLRKTLISLKYSKRN